MSLRLFTFDKDNNIVINKVEIVTYKPFNTIIRRDRGSEGDADGRKKLRAFSELAYIYHVADLMSVPNRSGYSDKETHIYAKTSANLPDAWSPDDVVKECIKIYKVEQGSISADVVNELLRAFRLTKSVISEVRISLERKITAGINNVDTATEVLSMIEVLIKYGRDIPKLTKELDKALTEVQLDLDNVELMRGNKLPVPDSAMPGKDW